VLAVGVGIAGERRVSGLHKSLRAGIGGGVEKNADGDFYIAEMGTTLNIRYAGPPFRGSWIGIVPKNGPPARSLDGSPNSYHIERALESGYANLKVPEAPGGFVIAMFDAEKDGIPIAFIPLYVPPKVVQCAGRQRWWAETSAGKWIIDETADATAACPALECASKPSKENCRFLLRRTSR
jgi:hypothetical protein